MNNKKRKRTLRKVMLSTYVEGRVWKREFLSGVLAPMEPDSIHRYVYLSTADNSNLSSPFYYHVGRGIYILALSAIDRKKKHHMEQMAFTVKEQKDMVTKPLGDGPFSKGETPMERRMRLIRENSLYGADGVTEAELFERQ